MRSRSDRRLSICFYSPLAMSLFDEATPGGHGGSELVLFHLACALAERGDFEVHFLLREEPAERVDGCDISVHRLETAVPRGEGPRFISVITNAIRGVRPFASTGAQVYVLAGASITLGYLGLYRLFAWRKRLAFIVASDADVEGTLLTTSRVERVLYRFGLRRTDIVWCQNVYQKETIETRYRKRASVLPNGLPVPSELPAHRKNHVLWVASCQPLKQPHAYLDLAEALPDTRFVMIMPARRNDELFSEVAERARSLQNVEFIDGVHYRQIQQYFDEALAFVNTSTVEGYPNTFVQAMIGGTPIVSLNVDPNGILGNSGLGLCAGGDEQRLLSHLQHFLSDEADRAAVGEKAFAYAREHHDIKKVAEEFAGRLLAVTTRG